VTIAASVARHALHSAGDIAMGDVFVFTRPISSTSPRISPTGSPDSRGGGGYRTGTKQGNEKAFVSSIYNWLCRMLFGAVADLDSVRPTGEIMRGAPLRPDWHRYVVVTPRRWLPAYPRPHPPASTAAGVSKFNWRFPSGC
jgi:hypothetical protein